MEQVDTSRIGLHDEARWRTKKVLVSQPKPRASAVPRRRSGFLRLPRAERTRKVTLRVVHKGGGESYWLIEARGEHQVFPGWMAIEDVMARVLSER